MGRWGLLIGAIAAVIGVAVAILAQAIETRQIQSRFELNREKYRAAVRLGALLYDAEIGQRGFLLTGSEKCLTAYQSAMSQMPEASSRFWGFLGKSEAEDLAAKVKMKTDELAETVRLYRSGDSVAALRLTKTDLGNSVMENVTTQIRRMADRSLEQVRKERLRWARLDRFFTWFSALALTLIAVALSLFALRSWQILAANERLTAVLKESAEGYRGLAMRLEDIREYERTQMARDLHDELGQSLTGIKMDIASAHSAFKTGQTDRLTNRLELASGNADEAIRSVRRLATQLRPPQLDLLGLLDAVQEYAEQFARRTGIEVQLGLPDGRLPLDGQQNTAIFRIVQESLTNVARHSQAKTVQISAHLESDEFTMTISDDGIGARPAAKGVHSLGLLGMTERAKSIGGELQFDSSPGAGATVRVSLPLAVTS